MSVKPSNVIPVLKDKLLTTPVIDFSAATATVDLLESVDLNNDWEVVDVSVVVTTAYVVSQAVTVNVGQSAGPGGVAADVDRFVDAQSLGAVAVGVGDSIGPLAQTTTKILQAGHSVTVEHTQLAGQTGEGYAVVRLRPKDAARGNVSKRPGGAADSAT